VLTAQAEKALKDDDTESRMRTELRNQQQRLRAKLAQIAGEKEVEAHDREQREEEAKRVAGTSNSHGSTAATVAKTHGMTALEAPGPQSNHVGGMTNEQLAHELLLDPDFRLDDKVWLSLILDSHTCLWSLIVHNMYSSMPKAGSVLTFCRLSVCSIEKRECSHLKIPDRIALRSHRRACRMTNLCIPRSVRHLSAPSGSRSWTTCRQRLHHTHVFSVCCSRSALAYRYFSACNYLPPEILTTCQYSLLETPCHAPTKCFVHSRQQPCRR
jgi:hypothetical protein